MTVRNRFAEHRRERQVRAVVRDALALRPRLIAALAKTDDVAELRELVDIAIALDATLGVLAPDEPLEPFVVTDIERIK